MAYHRRFCNYNKLSNQTYGKFCCERHSLISSVVVSMLKPLSFYQFVIPEEGRSCLTECVANYISNQNIVQSLAVLLYLPMSECFFRCFQGLCNLHLKLMTLVKVEICCENCYLLSASEGKCEGSEVNFFYSSVFHF